MNVKPSYIVRTNQPDSMMGVTGKQGISCLMPKDSLTKAVPNKLAALEFLADGMRLLIGLLGVHIKSGEFCQHIHAMFFEVSYHSPAALKLYSAAKTHTQKAAV